MPTISAFGAQDAATALAPIAIERRDPGDQDVVIDILFCGVCHSDLHFARNEWGFTTYPAVPGHEIVGRVSRVGAGVTRFKPGQLAAVGCLVDSCRHCRGCDEGEEQYCENGLTGTYGSIEKQTGRPTMGGYSKAIVVDQDFVLRVPESLDPAGVAPLLCAGITTYSPLRHWKIGAHSRVGVVGLGGLGHMGVKFACALGAHVVVLTTSPGKIADAERLGAHQVVLTTDAAAMKAHANSLDFILNTVSASMQLDPYLTLLRRDGVLGLVGAPPEPHAPPSPFLMLMKRVSVAGSMIGGIRETQEMLDFCAEHGITADIEIITMGSINEAYERLLKGDVKYRFVIDMASL
jgi:uncharacterized zinc-type alcohol dehydrogenase-like protein